MRPGPRGLELCREPDQRCLPEGPPDEVHAHRESALGRVQRTSLLSISSIGIEVAFA